MANLLFLAFNAGAPLLVLDLDVPFMIEFRN